MAYAQTDNSTGQDELRQQRMVAETIKQIENESAIVLSFLGQYLRCLKYVPRTDKELRAVEQTTQQAMNGLIEARRRENALFKDLLRIDDGIDATRLYADAADEALRQAKSRSEAASKKSKAAR